MAYGRYPGLQKADDFRGCGAVQRNQNAMYYGPRMAVAVLSAIPLVILYLILQKHIVASIAVTGIKQ